VSGFGAADQIRVPMPDRTYRDYPLLALLGGGYGQLQSAQGYGMTPVRILEQQGPQQQGTTTLDYRYTSRVLQVVLSRRVSCNLADLRWQLIDLLRPSRSFVMGQTPLPLIYRKWLPGGQRIRGTDLALSAGGQVVTSITGRFVHYGLRPGSQITISNSTADDGVHTIESVNHDGSITLTGAMTNDETGVHWEYLSEPTFRDLNCIVEIGPTWDLPSDRNLNGYVEVVRFIGSDPFWYGPEQQQSWALEGEFENLIFDLGYVPAGDEGGWLSATPGDGRWLFDGAYLSDTISMPYWGHHSAEPVIYITGPAANLVLTNTVTDASIRFNYTVPPGRVVTIDTLNLTVFDDLDNDLFLYLSGDLAGFIITPDVDDRINELSIGFGGASPESQVLLGWQNRYMTI